MPQFFSAANNLRNPAFVPGLIDTDYAYGIRTATFSGNAVIGTNSITVTGTGAGTLQVVFTPTSLGILPASTTITVPTLATDVAATTAIKLANALRLSPLGYYFNIVVGAATVTFTQKRPEVLLNLATIAIGVGNVSNSISTSITPATAGILYLPVGRLLSYQSTAFSAAPDANSVPRVGLVDNLATVCGITIYNRDAVLQDDNNYGHAPGVPFGMLTGGVVNLALANNVAAVAGGSLFVSVSGVNQGQIATTSINGTFQQINLPGGVFKLRPVSGLTTHGGQLTQKFRFTCEQ
jgi:hypothetical protein